MPIPPPALSLAQVTGAAMEPGAGASLGALLVEHAPALRLAAVLVLPWLLALVSTPLLARWAHAHGWLDRPEGRKAHAEPVAMLGGVAVFGSAAVGLALAALLVDSLPGDGGAMLLALGAGVACMVTLGLVDDAVDLRPTVKLVAQVGIAVGTWMLGFQVGSVSLPFGYEIVDAPLPSLLLTVGWIVVVSNAFNLIDGMDGLATGVGVIAALSIFLLAAREASEVPILAALALAGALAGFLRYNLPPARIFLGDAGAMTIGYTAAVIALETHQKSSTATIIAVPLILVLGVPILDVLLAVVRRGSAHLRERGVSGLRPGPVVRAIFRADRGHIHYLMLRAGWSERRVLFSLYLACGALAVLAFRLRDLDPSARWGIAAAVILAGLLGLRALDRHVERRERRESSTLAERPGGAAG